MLALAMRIDFENRVSKLLGGLLVGGRVSANGIKSYERCVILQTVSCVSACVCVRDSVRACVLACVTS